MKKCAGLVHALRMPQLSPKMQSGLLQKWRVQEGDYRKAYELLADIVPDHLQDVDMGENKGTSGESKAAFEIEVQEEFYLAKRLVQEGSHIPINTPIAIVCEEEKDINLCRELKVRIPQYLHYTSIDI